MRVNRAIEDGCCSRTTRSRRFERGGSVHLLGLVSHGGVHSHIDHLQALLTFAPRERDLDPRLHRRARRLAALGARTTSPSCPSTASPPSPAATTRWTATSAGIAPSARCARSWTARASTPPTRSRRSRRATTAGSPTSSSSPSSSTAGPARPRARHRDLLQLPPRPRTAALREARRAGVDLTTMTRYRDDFDFPVVFPEQIVERRLRRCSPATASASSTSAETEKYAHVTYFLNGGGEAAVARARMRILVDCRATCRATTTSRRCRPTRLPTAFVAADRGTATASWSSTSRTPTWSATRA